MRILGFSLLIAVLAVGFIVMKSIITLPVIQSVASPSQTATADTRIDELLAQVADLERELDEAPRAQPVVLPASEAAPPEAAVAVESCVTQKHDFNASVPSSVDVSDGHLLVASFFQPGQPEQVSVLSPGTWRNDAGWTFGAAWDYQNCPQERVMNEAQSHALRRSGNFLGVDQGLSRN